MTSHEAGLRHTMNPPCSAVLLTMILPLTLLACGPGVGPSGDAGADADDAGDAGVEIAAPNIPWLEEGTPPIAAPLFTPCPEGWHEVIEEDPDGQMDIVTCDPYGTEPEGTEPDTCPPGQAHFMGDPGCTPVGAPCPSGDFPEGLPADRAVVYVLAGTPLGGDGSEASPVSTITLGLALSSPGTIVAIGKGEYDEALRLSPGVTLWGACTRETRLTASTWGLLAQGVITVSSADTRVTNLWVGPAELPGIAAYGDRASLSVDGVVIDGAKTFGLRVTNGAHVDARELVVCGTRSNDTGHLGEGIALSSASSLDLRRGWISENRDVAVLVEHEGTSVTLSDVVIRNTLAQESDATAGAGLVVLGGARATVTRALLARNRDAAVLAQHDGTSLTLSDVVIRDTQARQSDRTRGRGLNIQTGATATVARTLIARNRDLGVYSSDNGTSLTLSDVVIRDTESRESDGTDGRGLGVLRGAVAAVTRTALFGNRYIGAYASGDGTSLALSDVVVHETQAQESNGATGRGLNIQTGAAATVTRVRFSQNRDVGVYASGIGTSLTLSDAVVRDTQGQESDGAGGRGLNVQEGATATVTRVLLSRNRDTGVFAHSFGTVVELLDVVVAETQERACADTTCREQAFGMGLLGMDEASLSATRFAVQDGALCGVMVAEDAQVDLTAGEVSGFPIGACLQVDGYSVSRLTDRVQYVDNVTNLDTTTLPVPELARPIDEAR